MDAIKRLKFGFSRRNISPQKGLTNASVFNMIYSTINNFARGNESMNRSIN